MIFQPAVHGPLAAEQSGASYVRHYVEQASDAILMLDMRGLIGDANCAAESMLGLTRSQLLGHRFRTCFADPASAESHFRAALADGQMHNFALDLRHKDGKAVDAACSIFPYRDESGCVQGMVASMRDISDLRQFETLMQFQVHYDALTALPNRVLFRERVNAALAARRRGKSQVVLLLLDLDDFRDVTETLGLQAGDDLLKQTASRLVDAMGETDMVARMGGDEFAVLMEQGGSAAAIAATADRLLDVVAQPYLLDDAELCLSCSIGVARPESVEEDVDSLLRKADAALYRAKADGKNLSRHFTGDMLESILRRVDIGKRLRHSIERNELELYYQPRAELGTGELTGMEALLRWHTGGGMTSPAEFIPVAESNGMIVQVGEWVLYEACRQARQWLDSFGRVPAVAVNLSARQLRDVDIVELVKRVLGDTGLPAHLLELELTEGMLMYNVPRILRILDGLKDIGVRLAVDDFGTGYSSLNYLKSFPLDYLKVDRSFVSDLPDDAHDGAIVRAIISMAHNLSLKVIAEGVETFDQVEFLLDQDCDEIQGYYFGKPLCVDDATAWLDEQRRLDLDLP